jgi:hypothetical protein
MKVDLALWEVHAAENGLAEELLSAGERHKTDHDVFHLTRTLASWCERHIKRLADEAARYGLELDATHEHDREGLLGKVRERGAELMGERPEPGVLLLRDLRELHLAAARASLAWTLLGQGAQAVRDQQLLDTVTACHPETIRTMKWTVQKLKESGPQVLAS